MGFKLGTAYWTWLLIWLCLGGGGCKVTLRTALESYSLGEALQTKKNRERETQKDESLSKMCIRIYNDTLKYNYFQLF